MPRCIFRLLVFLLGCTEPVDFPHCVSTPTTPADIEPNPTYHGHIQPILEGRCTRCHDEGGIGPMVLTDFDAAFRWRNAIQSEVTTRKMPPWMPADCCNRFHQDFSLAPEHIALIDRWVRTGAPEGDPSAPGPRLPAVGGLSRVDLEVAMPAAYIPEPAPGRLDDFRCFLLDWPLDEPVFVTGIQPVPGARAVLHHLVIGVISGEDVDAYEGVSSNDGQPGFDCEGGLGDLPITTLLGGSLLGGDFPQGLGRRVEGDSKLLLNVHYSLADAAPEADQTRLQFKIEPESAADTLSDYQGIPLANPAWLVGEGMRIEAGERRSFAYQFDPMLFTQGDRVAIRGATPHMHYLGEQVLMGVVHEDGSRTCLLDIQDWDFGWEQPFWFEQPVTMEPGDQVYIECTFSNTLDKQPVINGVPLEPRAVAWGSDNQDMCAGFLAFTRL